MENKMEYIRETDIMFNPPHPGELIREEYIKPLGITITQAARNLGVTRKALSDVVNEKAGISPTMALRLAKAFNTSAGMWISMQADYDLWQASQRFKPDDVKVMYG